MSTDRAAVTSWTPGPPPAVTDLDVAFGNVDHLPPWSAIPEEFKRWGGTEWERQVSRWWCDGADRAWVDRLVPKPGIEKNPALRALRALLASWDPKHEHKIAGAAYLASLWFDDPVLAAAGGAR